MHKTLTTMIASLATAMLLTAAPANATVYMIDTVLVPPSQ